MDQIRRTVFITGPTRGLGKECARDLAERGRWDLVLACRDAAAGAATAAEIRGSVPGATIDVVELDVASLASVRRSIAELPGRLRAPLAAVVCNAGIQVTRGPDLTEDGFERTFATNHLGHFLLVHGLLPHLAPRARIAVVSSGTHNPEWRTGMPHPRWRTFDALARPGTEERAAWERAPGVAGRTAYTTSKLCNVLFTYELGRRLAAAGRDDVGVHAFDPGLMPGTGLARDYGAVARFAWRFVLPALTVLPGVSTARNSGRKLADLVDDARYDGTTGLYVQIGREVRSSKQSYDAELAAELWDASVRLTSAEWRVTA